MDASESQRYILFNGTKMRVIVGLISAQPFIKPIEDFTVDDAGTWSYCQMLREYYLWGWAETTVRYTDMASEWEIVPCETVMALKEMMSL